MLRIPEFGTNNILVLPSIDSTNTYAHQLLAKGTGEHGMIIQAQHQTAGRGQRGNKWHSAANENLLMSIIINHQGSQLDSQFILNMAVCLALAEAIGRFIGDKKCSVKWSNDIYIDDEKVAGILIENIIKGSQWSHSIIGVGVNINCQFMDHELKSATSIYKQLGQLIDLNLFRNEMINCINEYLIWAKADEQAILQKYNDMLYKRNEPQVFQIGNTLHTKTIGGVNALGQLNLIDGNGMQSFYYGEAKQMIGSLN
jgi:BirA family transcriptional regulator, biotin operon repressor / biotin---[acetyl-CoA-carboxylase] ligase